MDNVERRFETNIYIQENVGFVHVQNRLEQTRKGLQHMDVISESLYVTLCEQNQSAEGEA